MDAVELALPAAVTVSKLMGSEAHGGGGGVTVMEVEARESDRVSIVISQKDEMVAVNTSESTFWNKMPDTELCTSAKHLSNFHCEDAPEDLKFGSGNSSLSSLESKQIQRKSGKVVRSSTGCSKRSRMAQMQDLCIDEAEADDVREKTQTAKLKNGLNAKRGDRRNKVPMKTKYDYFSLKAGMVSFNSAAGGNNFLGIYGLKPDTCDVTKHLDELSVNDLLDGNYKGPSFAKDKGKKAAIANENVLHSIRKACSILHLWKPLHSQNFVEIDSSYNHKFSTCPVSSYATVASRNDSDKGDAFTKDLSSHDKVQDSFIKPQNPAKVLDFSLYQPKDILERLALPPPKDLDSLLLDAAKPAVFSKSNADSCGKQISHRVSLPPFPWSHNSGGHCKSNADAVKLSASRTTCQGRWVKIGNTTSMEGRTSFLADLESLTYDQSLVPSGGLKCGPSENEIFQFASVSLPLFELGSSSSATCSIASQLPPESGSSLKCEGDAEHSPRLLAAAHTLYDIATHSLKQELHGMVRWPKKPSEKTMKACKSKSNKSGEIFVAPNSVTATVDQVRNANEMLSLKKPRLLINDKSKDVGDNTRKGTTNWSMPRSSRPSPSKTFRDSFAETKLHNASVIKQSWMMPPPSSRVVDKSSNSRQRLRKLVSVEWNREVGKD